MHEQGYQAFLKVATSHRNHYDVVAHFLQAANPNAPTDFEVCCNVIFFLHINVYFSRLLNFVGTLLHIPYILR